MERYADSFQSLADTFYRMPRKREHLTRDQVEQILDGQREKLCERCPKASWCWEQYYHLTTQQCMEILELSPQVTNSSRIWQKATGFLTV